jgi:hypothetical protein
MRVGQHAFFNTGKIGELVRLDDVRLYDVPDLMAQGVKIIRKQLPVALPGQLLGAHIGKRLLSG